LSISYILTKLLKRYIVMNNFMLNSDQLTQVQDLINAAKSILVIMGNNPTLDQTAAASALYLSLIDSGRQPVLLSPRPSNGMGSVMGGLQDLQTKLGNRDLSISFEYRPDAVDKVSYHIDEEENKFYLVIKPERGGSPLSHEDVEFSYTGADADLIFFIGVHNLESLEQLFFGYEQLYRDTMTVSFSSFDTDIGTIKLKTAGNSTLSEAMAGLLPALKLAITSDGATNLLTALENSTNNFSSLSTTAETFETVATLLRAGARRSRSAISKNKPALANIEKSHDKSELVPAQAQTQTQTQKNLKKRSGDLRYQPDSFSVDARG